ncbi:MAG: glycosyltransferase family 4 protein [Patescibacteria group bacterium]
MKVLMLSVDGKIFEENSAVRQRMAEYSSLVDELHIVVFTRRNFQFPISNFQTSAKLQIAKNVFAYPTNTKFKPLYFFDAYKICKSIIENLKLKIENCIITTQDPFETGLVGYWLKKKFKIPLQIQIHTDFLSPYFWRESLKNKLRVLLAKRLIKKADCLRVVSERIKESLESRIKNKESRITVLPIFVDVEKIRNAPVRNDLHKKYPNHDFIILMASRLTKEKNIDLAIGAFARIKNQGSGIMAPLLLIVGNGPERENLESRIKNYELGDSIRIESWTDDLISYYKTADLFLSTSNYEGYGMGVVEAATAGLPVIMTDVGVAIGKTVPVGDRKALSYTIAEMIKNPDQRAKVINTQEKFFQSWPTKQEYLDRIKISWQ